MKYIQSKNSKLGIDVNSVVQFVGEKQTYLVVSVEIRKDCNILQLTSNFNRKQHNCNNPTQLSKYFK